MRKLTALAFMLLTAAVSMVAAANDAWLTRPEVAQRLRVPEKTLAEWAGKKKGPRYARIGRFARYRLSDVIAWEEQLFGGGDAA